MAKSINEIVKKYRYQVRRSVRNYSIYVKKRIKSKNTDYNSLKLDSLAVNKLPYPVKWGELFDQSQISIEIGCGHGELLRHLASRNPDTLWLGFEVTKTYTLKTKKKLKDLDNAFVFKGDGYSNALNLTSEATLTKIYVLFPDPWHKKKHHKRRPLIEKWFRDIHSNLIDGGEIFFATDWMEYYDFVSKEFKKVEDIYNLEVGTYLPEEHGLIPTHYYLKWKEMGREFKYIRAIKIS
jgi:tRNA (guanine-N7-)-methyltransferase